MLIPSRTTMAGTFIPEILVDDCFADEVMKHSWHLCRGYPRTAIWNGQKAVGIYLHQFIWRLSGRQRALPELDHINRNPLDNRLENIREADRGTNTRNRKQFKARPGREGLTGVRKHGNKFSVKCCKKYIGVFDTPEEAHIAYLDARANMTKMIP
jgi:hypothetical protein